MRTTTTRRIAAVLLPLALLTAACETTRVGGTLHTRDAPEGPWLTPSPLLEAQIEDQVAQLPWTHGAERVEQIRWFASVGEPAYPVLLGLCIDPRPDVAGSALAALGATGDSRLVEHLHRLRWPADGHPTLALERARTYLQLGDWSEVPVLIEGLSSEDLYTRALCGHALSQVTGEGLGYDPQAEAAARQAAVERWQRWWQERLDEGLLVGRG